MGAELWTGGPCVGCDGTGVARWYPNSVVSQYPHFTPTTKMNPLLVTCPACNGHGREPY